MTFTLYYILAHEKVHERLRQDIRSKFSSAEEITGQSTSQLQYLDAVIYESISFVLVSEFRPAYSTGDCGKFCPKDSTGGNASCRTFHSRKRCHKILRADIDIRKYINLDNYA
jgi:hypothetical protein